MSHNDRHIMYVNFSHLVRNDYELAKTVLNEYYRHENALRRGLFDFMYNRHPDFAGSKIFNLSFYNISSTEKYIPPLFLTQQDS
jgi:DNA replicative helicase MCM subunit Mcm2 (Cdc46/Mcm family)